MSFSRMPTNQDMTWFLDLRQAQKLNLDPPYQRKSVWSAKDRKFFLDTIFRGYPSPAIYLHRSVDRNGRAVHDVIDGKQRLETVIRFFDNKIALGNDFGDSRLDGKRWRSISEYPELRSRFYDYVFSVDFINVDGDYSSLNQIFDRLNRNARKLNEQELRHARHDGWFISFVESQAEKEIWKAWGISTAGKSKRMKDAQFISELVMVAISGKVSGFDQDEIDAYCAQYDYPDEDEEFDFDPELFSIRFNEAVDFIVSADKAVEIRQFFHEVKHFYTLWAYVCTSNSFPPDQFAETYRNFMLEVSRANNLLAPGMTTDGQVSEQAMRYARCASGANTELPQREERLASLISYISEKHR